MALKFLLILKGVSSSGASSEISSTFFPFIFVGTQHQILDIKTLFTTFLENKQDLESFLHQERKACSVNTAWLGPSLLD